MAGTNAGHGAEWRRTRALADLDIGMLDADAPNAWTDDRGRTWQTPRTRNALNAARSSGHRALKEFVLRRDGHRCRWCLTTDDVEVDHIVSRRCGGAHHPGNLRALCGPCNSMKGAVVDARREAVP